MNLQAVTTKVITTWMLFDWSSTFLATPRRILLHNPKLIFVSCLFVFLQIQK